MGKEKQKQLQKEEKEKGKEEKTKTKPTEKVEEKPTVKVNSITKFLSRAKEEAKKPVKTEHEKKEEETESAKDLNSAPEISTPIRPSPAENTGSSASTVTPVTIKNPFTGTPYTPDPQRAQKMNIAKLKTRVTEL